MTVESSQPAPQQPAPPAEPAQSAQPASNQSVRIAALVVLGLVVVGVVAYLIFGRDSSKPHSKAIVQYIKPIGYTPQALSQESKFINTKFYWAGPAKQHGYLYEFRRTTNNHLFVRYLPPGVPVGASGAKYLIVATYPFTGAYSALKKEAGSLAIQGPNGSLIYVRPKDPRSVLMAFPGVNRQIEIYSPKAVTALKTARSGNVVPVSQQ